MTERAIGPDHLQRRLILFGVGVCRHLGKTRAYRRYGARNDSTHRESAVWLQLLNELAADASRAPLTKESDELIAIFVASLKTIGGR